MLIDITGDTMTITVDISKAAQEAAPLSKSEKNRLVATTHGFTRYGAFGVSLNVTSPK